MPGDAGPRPSSLEINNDFLRVLNNAKRLEDPAIPPNNQREALKRDREGQHGIDDQWRIGFVWTNGGLAHVEIVDYH